MDWFANALRQHPELALFLTLAIGYALGKIRFGSVQLGAVTAAGTSAPGLAAVQEVARSKIPTLGYGVTYAIGNVLLALWGSVMVLLMAR